jgi:hypothetical protein
MELRRYARCCTLPPADGDGSLQALPATFLSTFLAMWTRDTPRRG